MRLLLTGDTPPADSVQDYILFAVSPGGIVTQGFTTVKGENTWKAYPKWVKGVRVYGVDDGVQVKLFGEKK